MNAEVAFYFQLLLRRLPVMTVIFALCAAFGVAFAVSLPPQYSADATLLVEGAQIPEEFATSTVSREALEQLQIIEQRLMTRANLIDVANKHNVFPPESQQNPDTIVKIMRAATEIELTAGHRDEATLMQIKFTAADPDVAANVVNEMVTLVLSADAKIRQEQSGETLEFFEQQVARLNQELSKQSAEIVLYKEANKDALPEGLQYRMNRQSTLQERLNLAARDRASLTEQRTRLISVGDPSQSQGIRLTPEQAQLSSLRAQLLEWEAVLSGTNPRVKVLREKIAVMEQRIEGVDAENPNGTTSILDLQIAEIDSRIDFIDDDIARTETELAEINQSIEDSPRVAIRLDELDREYENTQTLYNEAVSARAAAQTGDRIEVAAKGERVSIIEQAVAPIWPEAPNRKLIAGGGVFAGTALAALFFIITEVLDRTIRRPIDLTRALGIQPLATIPFLEEETTRRRKRAIKTILVVGSLISIPLALWVIHTFYLPLDLVLDKIMEQVGG